MIINKILEAMIAALLVAAVGVAFVAVIYRYVLDSALSWSFEVSLALLTYITFLGGYLALRRNAHLKVDLLVRRLPFWARGVLFLFNQAVIATIGWIMAWHGGRQVLRFADQTTNVLEISTAWYYIAIPIAGGLICLDALWNAVRGLLRLTRGQEPVDSAPDALSAEI
ncbi:TRAP-type C4-dicarboxylate transport system, small permease component [Hoeflea sp. IMCC20628]|uniref:TRAP transporter small permease n=1 Tax=Hoeflea sp. IMCC20628 TaxID=1620421 RepID=UPI00063BF2C1|nr:TRAP transporter small permease [Hoeflea sp. IMCC20628]AKI00869.1 TRAP-type C4-dicarboxylate transport system, small permease component [Hoeflea sp. IMCC20628]